MVFAGRTLAPNASAVSKPAIKSKLEITLCGLDTTLAIARVYSTTNIRSEN